MTALPFADDVPGAGLHAVHRADLDALRAVGGRVPEAGAVDGIDPRILHAGAPRPGVPEDGRARVIAARPPLLQGGASWTPSAACASSTQSTSKSRNFKEPCGASPHDAR